MRDYIPLSLRGFGLTYNTTYVHSCIMRVSKHITIDYRTVKKLNEEYPNSNHSRMFEKALLEKYDIETNDD